jgi:ubiquinol-cytochrome c reductase cytochrome b subunit
MFKLVLIAAAAGARRLNADRCCRSSGVWSCGGAVVILFFLPWLDYSEVKSIRYRLAGTRAYMALS